MSRKREHEPLYLKIELTDEAKNLDDETLAKIFAPIIKEHIRRDSEEKARQLQGINGEE